DGSAGNEELKAAAALASPVYETDSLAGYAGQVAGWVACADDGNVAVADAADWASRAAAGACPKGTSAWAAAFRAEQAEQVALLRDLFGNPFRPVPTIAPAWLSWNGGTVPRLAPAIYDGRAFGRMPVLADALEGAGCTDADILAHCRQGAEHVRGCWVVDLLLGKE